MFVKSSTLFPQVRWVQSNLGHLMSMVSAVINMPLSVGQRGQVRLLSSPFFFLVHLFLSFLPPPEFPWFCFVLSSSIHFCLFFLPVHISLLVSLFIWNMTSLPLPLTTSSSRITTLPATGVVMAEAVLGAGSGARAATAKKAAAATAAVERQRIKKTRNNREKAWAAWWRWLICTYSAYKHRIKIE